MHLPPIPSHLDARCFAFVGANRYQTLAQNFYNHVLRELEKGLPIYSINIKNIPKEILDVVTHLLEEAHYLVTIKTNTIIIRNSFNLSH